MKQSTRFNITVIVLSIVLVVSIALLVRVYSANEKKETTESQTTTIATTTQSETTTTAATTSEAATTTTTTTTTTATTQETTTEPTTTQTTVPETTVIIDSNSVIARTQYLGADAASRDSVLNEIISQSKKTELNAVVIDIKEGGVILYDSYVPEVRDNKLYIAVFDAKHVLEKLQAEGIYVIGRIVCFKDNRYAQIYPERAIKSPTGGVAKSDGSAWANPYIEANWDYNIAIAKEAALLGFDEIQFDYVRFPSAGKSTVDYGEADIPAYSRAEAVAAFLKKAYTILKPLGVNISADVFAITCISDVDARAIGQRVDWIGKYVDYICPMIYPSHYANSSNGSMGNGVGQGINGVHFTKPDLFPYEVVYNTLISTQKMLEGKEGIIAKIRPYIQDFTATYLPEGYYQTYGPEQVRAQVKAIYDAGYSEWILWNSGNGSTKVGNFLEK